MKKRKIMYNTQYMDYYIEKNEITKKEFCKRCGISLQTFNNLYNFKDMNVLEYINVVDFLNITIDTFLFREKFYKERPIK